MTILTTTILQLSNAKKSWYCSKIIALKVFSTVMKVALWYFVEKEIDHAICKQFLKPIHVKVLQISVHHIEPYKENFGTSKYYFKAKRARDTTRICTIFDKFC